MGRGEGAGVAPSPRIVSTLTLPTRLCRAGPFPLPEGEGGRCAPVSAEGESRRSPQPLLEPSREPRVILLADADVEGGDLALGVLIDDLAVGVEPGGGGAVGGG